MDKLFLKKFLKGITFETFKVKFWDGTTEIYGEGKPKFEVIFNKALSKKKVLEDACLAFGEAYMDKVIELKGNLQEIIEAIYKTKDSFLNKSKLLNKLSNIKATSLKKQKKDVQYHYDLGNDFYKLWLDETMSYSCGYFVNPEDSLYEAQINKINYILRKLNLKEGEKLLDIGSGWGWLIIEAAKQYKVNTLGITLSEEQYLKTKERIKKEKLEDLVEVKLMDYRELVKSNEKFDKIVSVGMIEHVGRKNIPLYMKTVGELLKEEGVSLLHCITGQVETEGNEWIKKYIFPGGCIPTMRELVSIMPDYDFHIVDIESLRLHYCKTLEHWAHNFEQSLDEVKKKFDERFIRMWRLYLNACAASFHYGVVDIHQFVFTKGLNNDLPITRSFLYK